jgi:small subunit ribosomal protein S11
MNSLVADLKAPRATKRTGAFGSNRSQPLFGNESTDSLVSFVVTNASPVSPPNIVHITSNRNNTVATFTDPEGNALAWASAGTCGLKKANRGSPDAGYQVILQLAEKIAKKNVKMDNGVDVRLKGFGPGREMSFKALRSLGWTLKRVADVSPIRHAGCRPPVKRRL